MTEMATPVARRASANAGWASLDTPPTLAVPSYSVSELELQVSRLSVEHRHLSAMVQAMTARHSVVQTQLVESTAALRDALRANSDAAAAARRRARPSGSSADEVSLVLGKQLRPLQSDAIHAVLDGKDTWLILPAPRPSSVAMCARRWARVTLALCPTAGWGSFSSSQLARSDVSTRAVAVHRSSPQCSRRGGARSEMRDRCGRPMRSLPMPSLAEPSM